MADFMHLIRLCDLWLTMCLQPSRAHFCGRIVNHCSVERVGFRNFTPSIKQYTAVTWCVVSGVCLSYCNAF